MDPTQPWGWSQHGQGGYAPPMPRGFNPFFGMPSNPPFNFNPSWNQATSQHPFSQTNRQRQQINGRGRGGAPFTQPMPQPAFSQASQFRPQNDGRDPGGQGTSAQPASRDPFPQVSPNRRQNEGRSRGQGDFYRPASPFGPPRTSQQNRQIDGGNWRDDANDREYRPSRNRRRRAATSPKPPRPPPAPTWTFPEDRPLAFPMNNQAVGPFGATRPVRQNNALNAGAPISTSLPIRPLRPNHPSQVPNLATTGVNTNPNTNKAKATKRPAPPSAVNPSNHRREPTSNERDAISAPSAASGGIPNPTDEYLRCASFVPCRLDKPKPILVVIDLNGTLLYRPHKRNAFSFVERPLAKTFLQRCIDKHHVVIWSSARPENVRRMCEQLLPAEYLSRVVAVWGRDRFGLSADDYNRRTQCYKRLTRLWEDPVVGGSHPQAAQGAVWDQGNTVLIDDSAEKARSEPHNAVTLPEFAGDLKENPQVLPLVEDYLDALAMYTDVSTYIRVKPFTMRGRQPVAVIQEKN
ncbi:HAD-like protein [Parathielavia appendiculata]|uniref:Mitochondrial import inner membrane translocase subunit TIM50 n=1 Tax=Parathielavia appendiculata TaxID=2587402 RepID=A0AAN6U6Q4_9PEZI|nr:HAD-like protein [Parathielavia appendiculata]